MELISKCFLGASLIYLLLGTTMGLVMAFKSGKWVLRLMPSHAHVNLAGWISMMIFGFAYFLLPMAAGRELYSKGLAFAHFFLSNIGLVGMAAVFFGSRFPNSPISPRLVWPFGLLLIISIWIFVFNAGMTLFA